MHRVIASFFRSSRAGRTKLRFPANPEIQTLARGETISFWASGEPLVRLTCLTGILWITCEGDFQDYFLTRGQQFIPRSRGQVVINALSPASVVRGTALAS